MRRRPAIISDEDAALFREAIGPVRAIEAPPPAPCPPRPQARAGQRERDEADALRSSRVEPFATEAASSGDSLTYRRDGISERIWRRLRRGQFAVQDEIDLHHMDAASAERSLRSFLLDARGHDRLCLRIIHGKGLHSKAGTPVLRSLVEGLLRRRAEVLAYVSAPPAMGGTGALLVLLSRRRAGEQAGP